MVVFLAAHTVVHTRTQTQRGPGFQRDVSGRRHVKDAVRWSLTLGPERCRRDVFVPGSEAEEEEGVTC